MPRLEFIQELLERFRPSRLDIRQTLTDGRERGLPLAPQMQRVLGRHFSRYRFSRGTNSRLVAPV